MPVDPEGPQACVPTVGDVIELAADGTAVVARRIPQPSTSPPTPAT